MGGGIGVARLPVGKGHFQGEAWVCAVEIFGAGEHIGGEAVALQSGPDAGEAEEIIGVGGVKVYRVLQETGGSVKLLSQGGHEAEHKEGFGVLWELAHDRTVGVLGGGEVTLSSKGGR